MENARQKVNDILSRLSTVLELSDLVLDKNNKCLILFDDKIVINLELTPVDNDLYLYSYLGLVPFFAKENILELLLESNFFWKESFGSTFAIDGQTQTLVLEKKINLDLLKESEFEDILASFVDSVDFWMKRIFEIETEAEMLTNEDKAAIKNKLDKDLSSEDLDSYGSWKY